MKKVEQQTIFSFARLSLATPIIFTFLIFGGTALGIPAPIISSLIQMFYSVYPPLLLFLAALLTPSWPDVFLKLIDVFLKLIELFMNSK